MHGVRGYNIRKIFDIAGNISAQPPPKKILMEGSKLFDMALHHNLYGEGKIIILRPVDLCSCST